MSRESYAIRLADRLLSGSTFDIATMGVIGERVLQRGLDELKVAPRFILDEAFEYWAADMDLPPDHYLHMGRPPFDLMWVEGRAPAQVTYKGETRPMGYFPTWWGALVRVTPGAHPDIDTADDPTFALRVHESVRTSVFCIFPPSTTNTRQPIYVGDFLHGVDRDGAVVAIENQRDGRDAHYQFQPSIVAGEFELLPPAAQASIKNVGIAVAPLFDPMLFSFQLMDCVNVLFTEVAPPPKLSKAHQRRTGAPLTIFKRLHVFRRRDRALLYPASERDPDALPQRRLHIVRGHFCHRRKAGYGRRQRWWRHPHARGDASLGRIEKEYEIHPDGGYQLPEEVA